MPTPEERLARLLEVQDEPIGATLSLSLSLSLSLTLAQVQDESIGATLQRYANDQELGDQINYLTEAYFQQHPRSYDAAWPSYEHRASDVQLRNLFEQLAASKGSTVKDLTFTFTLTSKGSTVKD